MSEPDFQALVGMPEILRLQGGLQPPDGADPRTFPGVFNPLADLLEDMWNQLQAFAGANAAMAIVELETGGWSGDAPPDRENGEKPIFFIPRDPDSPTDPAGVNGIDTPQNIRDWDVLLASVAP